LGIGVGVLLLCFACAGAGESESVSAQCKWWKGQDLLLLLGPNSIFTVACAFRIERAIRHPLDQPYPIIIFLSPFSLSCSSRRTLRDSRDFAPGIPARGAYGQPVTGISGNTPSSLSNNMHIKGGAPRHRRDPG
jgi:hypothetical protein